MKPRASQLRLVGISEEAERAAWLADAAGHLAPADRQALGRALEFVGPLYADKRLPSGEPLLEHALEAARLLGGLRLDQEALAAALLFHCQSVAPESAARLRESFGGTIADLVDGVVRMGAIGALSEDLGSESNFRPRPGKSPRKIDSDPISSSQLEALRKMLLAMVQDVRVVLVGLADHMQTLRHAVRLADGESRRETARRTRDVYAPLANRLGVWQFKWEMEDLAFRILEPENYQRIARLLDEKRGDRERYLENVIALLKGELNRAGIAAEVTGRPKHFYSIAQKMKRKGYDFEAVYDVRAVRVLVDQVKDCYAVLGLVHNLWSPIPKEFDDYIARPKPNQYRSLHTAVTGPEGKAVEVQIRTHEMHQASELGVAAHWRYKEGRSGERGYDEKIAWLRQILEWKDQIGDAGELAEQFRTGLFDDTIYVLTPQGRVIDLPKGATPIDFAYHVHTELGHRCRGAKVDGAMVPLDTPLANGQQVEILAAKQGGPSRDWLNPALGYVASHGARAKVRQWFNRQNLETAIAQGRSVVEKELQRLGMTRLGTAVSLEKLAARLGFDKVAEFFAEVGRGEVGHRQLQNAIGALDPRTRETGSEPGSPAQQGARGYDHGADAVSPRKPRAATDRGSILVVGVDRLLTAPAKCCKPAPPDAIVGFVTRGRGVTIHRAGCANVARLAAERVVAAAWGESAGATYPVEVEVHAADRAGLRREIAEALAREGIGILASASTASDGAVRMRYTLAVADLDRLRQALGLIQQVRGVARAARR